MSLSSLNLTASQKNVFAASAAIQTYAAAILNQEDIKLNALSDLPKHQQVARQHARKWNEQVLPASSRQDECGSHRFCQWICCLLPHTVEIGGWSGSWG